MGTERGQEDGTRRAMQGTAAALATGRACVGWWAHKGLFYYWASQLIYTHTSFYMIKYFIIKQIKNTWLLKKKKSLDFGTPVF